MLFIHLGRFRYLCGSPCSRTNSYDCRFGCGSYRFDGGNTDRAKVMADLACFAYGATVTAQNASRNGLVGQ
eukprot:COSAG02_NODE_66_length_42609_cov_95.996848_33_plen_71_part_00